MRRVDPYIDRVRQLFEPFANRVNLDVLLAQAQPDQTLPDRVEWLHDLIQWLRSPFLTPDEKESLKDTRLGFRARAQRQRKLQTVRLRYCLQMLDRNPEWKANVAKVLRSILFEASAADLFSSSGLHQEAGFFSEASNRIQKRILPAPLDTRDFAALFVRLFRDDSDADWIRGLPIETIERVLALFHEGADRPDEVFDGLRQGMIEALLILGPEIGAMGLSPELRARMDDRTISASPFHSLNESLLALVHVMRGEKIDLLPTLISKIADDRKACRARIQQVIKHLEEKGVSIALVYKLERLGKSLDRVEVLLDILIPSSERNKIEVARDFMALLVEQSIEGTKLRRLIGSNLDLISQKVVERVGFAGDHYIAATPKEYWHMLWAGGGGGVVTVFTTVVKTFALHAGLPLFFEGFLAALNYAASFLIIHFAHFALATKQPSMTATALANRLRSLNDRQQLDRFVDEVARITRTQFSAAVGNVAFVVVGSLLFDLLYRKALGHSLMDEHYAHKTIESFNPFTSATVPAAALTGVILWFSAVAGGWFENWAVFRRMPDAIASNRILHAVIGVPTTQKVSKFFTKQIAGIVSNITIGLLLGFTPIIGKFFGLPIDIRHVTLSSGSVTFALSAIGVKAAGGWPVALAVLGIFVIFLLNFGVSYALALFVALRARRIKRVWVYHFLRAAGRRFLVSGFEFFLPVGRSATKTTQSSS